MGATARWYRENENDSRNCYRRGMRPGLTRQGVVRCVAAAALVLATAGCGSGDDAHSGRDGDHGAASIVVTTTILGDVVAEIAGDAAEVTTVMPVGADPHDFQASARQANQMRSADLLVVNGGGFEEGLEDVVDGAREDGVAIVAATAGDLSLIHI